MTHKEILQKEIQSIKSVITDNDRDFIMSQYKLEHTGNYILYAYTIGYDKPHLREKVNELLNKGVGSYTTLAGHIIPSYLIH